MSRAPVLHSLLMHAAHGVGRLQGTSPTPGTARARRPVLAPRRARRPLLTARRARCPLLAPRRARRPLLAPRRARRPLLAPRRVRHALLAAYRARRPLLAPRRAYRPLLGCVAHCQHHAGRVTNSCQHQPAEGVTGHYGQFTYGLNASMTGIVAARCDPAAAQWAVVRAGMPAKMTE
eukprot:364104-Chlamydomonas_euryale.AAC.9